MMDTFITWTLIVVMWLAAYYLVVKVSVWIINKDLPRVKEHRGPQTTFIYCPECNAELTTSRSHIGGSGPIEVYCCSSCGTYSEWQFDAPTPLLVDHLPETK